MNRGYRPEDVKLAYLGHGANAVIFRVDFSRGRNRRFVAKIAFEGKGDELRCEKALMQELVLRQPKGWCKRYFVTPVSPTGNARSDASLELFVAELARKSMNALVPNGKRAPNGRIPRDEPSVYFMELVPKFVALDQWAKRATKNEARETIKQLRRAVWCMFRAGYVHTDLHADNVGVSVVERKRGSRTFRVRVLDFGRAVRLKRELPAYIEGLGRANQRRWAKVWFDRTTLGNANVRRKIERFSFWWPDMAALEAGYRPGSTLDPSVRRSTNPAHLRMHDRHMSTAVSRLFRKAKVELAVAELERLSANEVLVAGKRVSSPQRYVRTSV